MARGPEAVYFAYALPLLGMIGALLYAFRYALPRFSRLRTLVPVAAT